MKYYLATALLLILSGCMSGTTTTYDKNLAISNSQSETIRLSFADTKYAPYYLILMSNATDEGTNYLLKVRWVNPDKTIKQFSMAKSSLKFIINQEKILSLLPIKEPIITGYDINTGGCEEETIYPISRELIEEMSLAKTIDVELSGRNKVVIGKFNKWHSFQGFKNFLKNETT